MEKKMTIRDKFVALMANHDFNDDERAFLENEIAKIDTKVANKKPTATQIANESIKKRILEAMEDYGVPVTVTQVVASLEYAYTNQKLSPLMNSMAGAGILRKFMDGRVTYFEIVRG